MLCSANTSIPENQGSIITHITITLTQINLLLPPLLTHLPIRTPTQQQERRYNQQSANDGCWAERNARPEPVDDRY